MLASLLWPFTQVPMHKVLRRQLYFSGVQSVGVCTLAGAAVGAAVVALMQGNFGQSGATALYVLAVSTVQELAPLLVALIFTARSASALATEMATMRVTGELRSLLRMGIDLFRYITWPRVVAAGASCALLYCYFFAAALLAGALLTPQANLLAELRPLFVQLQLHQVLLGLAKSAWFGALAATVACAIGDRARHAVTEIPRLASQAVLMSIIAILASEAFIVIVLSLLQGQR